MAQTTNIEIKDGGVILHHKYHRIASPSDVQTFYMDQLQTFGSPLKRNSSTVIIAAKGDGWLFVSILDAASPGTTVLLGWNKK